MSLTTTKRLAAIAATAGAVALTAGPASAALLFTSVLDSAQEVAPAGVTASPLTGSASLELTDLGGGNFSLAFEIFLPSGFDYQFLAAGTDTSLIPTTDPLAVTRLHIHNGARGVNGPVVYGIFNPDQDVDNDVAVVLNADGSATVTGSWGPGDGNPAGNINTFAPQFVAALPGDDVSFYFNLHTNADPFGVIRGQLVAAPAPAALALFGLGAAALGVVAARRARG